MQTWAAGAAGVWECNAPPGRESANRDGERRIEEQEDRRQTKAKEGENNEETKSIGEGKAL